MTAELTYGIRDLGSIGGVFIRIPWTQSHELHPGMIILIGQHQFTVSSIIDNNDNIYTDTTEVEAIMSDAEQLLSQISISLSLDTQMLPTKARDRLKALTNRLSEIGSPIAISATKINPDNSLKKHQSKAETSNLRRQLTLTCFQPEGSPILGKNFVIGSDGGTIGRRSSNQVAIHSETIGLNGTIKTIVVDNAVSNDHASIEMNLQTGQFYIKDGVNNKVSTNGIWWRLSGPNQQSTYYQLNTSTEILVGKSRFQVSESMTIAEKEVSSVADSK